jgi:putative ABC transport system permease protein
VQRETDTTAQSKQVAALLEIVATTVGAIMAVGALFSALNTMYSAISTHGRNRHTAAIGFGALPVVVSVMVEAQVLAFIGAVAGSAIAWLLFNGNAFSTGGALGQVAVRLHVGLPLVVGGMTWAAVVGLFGGLFPAIRAARASVVDSLRVV